MSNIYETSLEKSSLIIHPAKPNRAPLRPERVLSRRFCISQSYARLIAELQGYGNEVCE
jgi:hypothetical protein